MKVNELPAGMQEFLNEIKAQMDGQVCWIFESVLNELGKPGKAEAEKLRFLQCLQNAGVDSWKGYDEALNEMEEYKEAEEDEDD